MKEFIKILGLAIVCTAIMFGIGIIVANIIRPYDREVISCIILSIVGVGMTLPVFLMDAKKDWVANIAIFCMSYIPMQAILVAMFL